MTERRELDLTVAHEAVDMVTQQLDHVLGPRRGTDLDNRVLAAAIVTNLEAFVVGPIVDQQRQRIVELEADLAAEKRRVARYLAGIRADLARGVVRTQPEGERG